jgi:hypothetical protein
VSRTPARLAALVLVLGGLALGAAPLPLASFGCGPAFAGSDEVLDQTLDVVTSCAESRADRQGLAGAVLIAGAALGAGSVAPRRRAPAEPAAPVVAPRVDAAR